MPLNRGRRIYPSLRTASRRDAGPSSGRAESDALHLVADFEEQRPDVFQIGLPACYCSAEVPAVPAARQESGSDAFHASEGDLRAHLLKLLDTLVEAGHDARLEAVAAELLDQADLEALQIALHAFAGGGDHRTRAFRNGGGVALVVSADDLLQQGRVEHGTGARADLIEGGRHGDGAEAGDAAVGRLDADGAGQ